MEKLYIAIRDFLTGTFNEALTEYDDETYTLPRIEAEQIVFGAIDPVRMTYPVCVSVYPESQESGEGTISEDSTESAFTVTFVCRSAVYEELVARMCRYAAAFKKAIGADYSLGGAVSNSQTGTVRFYPDCGTAERQMTAAEINLTIYTNEEYEL